MKAMKEPEDCHRWESCDAQLCPLSNEFSVWHWDEETCKLKRFQNEDLIKNQKKISRRKAEGSFTKSMLDRRIIIGKRMKGLMAGDGMEAEYHWMQRHREYLNVMTDRRCNHEQSINS